MEKLQNKHMEAVEAIICMTMANELLTRLDEVINELPTEFDKSKSYFKQFKLELETTIDKAILTNLDY